LHSLQLQKVQTGVAEIIRFCRNYASDSQIVRKTFGGVKLVSGIHYTKPKAKRPAGKECVFDGGVAADSGSRAATVFPGRGNLSPIGICKGSSQRHPGKATASTPRLFCKWCGIYVGSKLVYTFLETVKLIHYIRFATASNKNRGSPKSARPRARVCGLHYLQSHSSIGSL